MSDVFPPESRRLLADHGVSEKQYMIWGMQRFFNLSFKAGLVITAVVAGFFGYIGYGAYGEDPVEGWIALGIGLFFVLLFGGVAFSMKHGGPEYAYPTYLTVGHELLEVFRITSEKFIKKLKDRDWEAIRRVDVKAYEVGEAAREAAKRLPAQGHDGEARIERLQRLKKRMRKIGLWGLILFFVLIALVPSYLTPLFEEALWWRFVLMILLGVAYLAPLIGLHGWLFLLGYLGVKLRKIFVAAEWMEYDTIYRGKTAVVLGWIAMLAAAVSFATFAFLAVGLGGLGLGWW